MSLNAFGCDFRNAFSKTTLKKSIYFQIID